MATLARSSARSVGLGAAIALHALLLMFVGAALRERPRALKENGATVQVRLLPLPSPARPVPKRTAVTAIEPPLPQEPGSAAPVATAPTEAPLLETEATQRAIAEAARRPSHTASSAQERLGRDIARAAHGDCLKGEYAGGGMGLLSLPFWIAAELRDKCRR